ncbi:MAG: hypothetical protein ACRD25_06125 [Terracidiphilus sp.]
MNTEYAVGKIRIRFESRARRRWFVALFYAILAVWVLATLCLNKQETTGAWIVAGGMTLTIVLLLFFWSVAGDMNARGDEREMRRREHAHFRAYRILGSFFAGAFFAEFCFRGPNPITLSAPLVLRGFLMQLPYALLIATLFLYVSLPQAVLLWTEPDMDSEKESID